RMSGAKSGYMSGKFRLSAQSLEAGRALRQGHTIDLDVERREPFGSANEDARRGIFRKIARIDRVDGGEVPGRGAVDVALHHVLQRRARSLEAQFQLFKDEFGLTLDRAGEKLAGIGI